MPVPPLRERPAYAGEPGTNGQHSFCQLLHQGTRLIPADLIGFAQGLNPLRGHHDILSSNVFAQAQALAFGKTEQEVQAEGTPDLVVPDRVMQGNWGAIWGTDSFDQWGVELGNELAWAIIPELESAAEPDHSHDSSTNALDRRRHRALKG